jgi:hypothetical protein
MASEAEDKKGTKFAEVSDFMSSQTQKAAEEKP